jgi:hypothetical protein
MSGRTRLSCSSERGASEARQHASMKVQLMNVVASPSCELYHSSYFISSTFGHLALLLNDIPYFPKNCDRFSVPQRNTLIDKICFIPQHFLLHFTKSSLFTRQTMKAARFYGKGDIRVEEVAEPEPGPNEVLVAPAYAGICGSDLHEYEHGAHPFQPLLDTKNTRKS